MCWRSVLTRQFQPPSYGNRKLSFQLERNCPTHRTDCFGNKTQQTAWHINGGSCQLFHHSQLRMAGISHQHRYEQNLLARFDDSRWFSAFEQKKNRI